MTTRRRSSRKKVIRKNADAANATESNTNDAAAAAVEENATNDALPTKRKTRRVTRASKQGSVSPHQQQQKSEEVPQEGDPLEYNATNATNTKTNRIRRKTRTAAAAKKRQQSSQHENENDDDANTTAADDANESKKDSPAAAAAAVEDSEKQENENEDAMQVEEDPQQDAFIAADDKQGEPAKNDPMEDETQKTTVSENMPTSSDSLYQQLHRLLLKNQNIDILTENVTAEEKNHATTEKHDLNSMKDESADEDPVVHYTSVIGLVSIKDLAPFSPSYRDNTVTIHWNQFTESQLRAVLFKLFVNLGYGSAFKQLMIFCILHGKLNGLLLIHDIVDSIQQQVKDSSQQNTLHFLFHHLSQLLSQCYMRFLVKVQYTCEDHLVGYTSNLSLQKEHGTSGGGKSTTQKTKSNTQTSSNGISSTSRKRPRSELSSSTKHGSSTPLSVPPPSKRKKSPSILYSNFFYTVSWFGSLMTLLLQYVNQCLQQKNNITQLMKENIFFIGTFFHQLVEDMRGKLLWICFRRQHKEVFFNRVMPVLLDLSKNQSSPSYSLHLHEMLSVLTHSEPSWITPLEYGYVRGNTNTFQHKPILLVYSLLLDQLSTQDIMVTSLNNTFSQLLCIRSMQYGTPKQFLADLVHASLICTLRMLKQYNDGNPNNTEHKKRQFIPLTFLCLKLIYLICMFKQEYEKVRRLLPSMCDEDPISYACSYLQKVLKKPEISLFLSFLKKCAQFNLLHENLVEHFKISVDQLPVGSFEQASEKLFQHYDTHHSFLQHIKRVCEEEKHDTPDRLALAQKVFQYIGREPLSLDLLQVHGYIPNLITALLRFLKLVYNNKDTQSHLAFSLYLSVLYLILERFHFRDTPHHKAFLETVLTELDMAPVLQTTLLNFVHLQQPQHDDSMDHENDDAMNDSDATSPMETGDLIIQSCMEADKEVKDSTRNTFFSKCSPLDILSAIPYTTQQWIVALRAGVITPDQFVKQVSCAVQLCKGYFELEFFFYLHQYHRYEISQHIPTFLNLLERVCKRDNVSAIWLRKLHANCAWFSDEDHLRAQLDQLDELISSSENRLLTFSKFIQNSHTKSTISYYKMDRLTEDYLDMSKAIELLKIPILSQFSFFKQLRHYFSLNTFVRLIFDAFSSTDKVFGDVSTVRRSGFEFGNLVDYHGLAYFMQHIVPCIYHGGEDSSQEEQYAKKLAIFSAYACIRVYSRGKFPCIEGLCRFLKQCLQSDNNVSISFSLEFLSVLMKLSSLLSAVLFSPETRKEEGKTLAFVWKDAVFRNRDKLHLSWRDTDALQFFDFNTIVQTKDEEQIEAVLCLFNE